MVYPASGRSANEPSPSRTSCHPQNPCCVCQCGLGRSTQQVSLSRLQNKLSRAYKITLPPTTKGIIHPISPCNLPANVSSVSQAPGILCGIQISKGVTLRVVHPPKSRGGDVAARNITALRAPGCRHGCHPQPWKLSTFRLLRSGQMQNL